MKARQLTIWMIVFSVVAACAIVYMSKPWERMGDEFERLVSGDILKSDKIVLVGNSDTLVFSKIDTSWIDELGAIVSREMVENILFATDRLQKKSIVGEAEISGCDYGVKVELLKNEKSVCNFIYASGNLGDFIYSEGVESAFGVELPGFETLSLRKVYSSNRDHYHLHLLIDLLPSDIMEVEVWPLSGSSFRIIQDKEFNLTVFEGESDVDIVGDLNEHKLRMLLTYFNSITYSEQLDDSVLKSDVAIAKIRVVDFGGEEMEMEVFSKYGESEGDIDLYKSVVKYSGKSELLSVDFYYLDLLMRGISYYK